MSLHNKMTRTFNYTVDTSYEGGLYRVKTKLVDDNLALV